VRSAVGQFLFVRDRKKAPRTLKLLHDAPEIDWPMVRAARDFSYIPKDLTKRWSERLADLKKC
jgi:hypothetical protein